MKVGIIGYGLEGQAAYDYWKDKADITICDINNIEAPNDVDTQIGQGYLADLSRFDLIVRSPIIKPQDLIDSNNGQTIKSKITTNTNEFFRVCPTANIIGVTGTKGKGTTSTLISKLLETAGKTVYLGGNIGVPALELLKKPIQNDDWIVLELSSFQLIDLVYSPHIAVCLMIAPEHLDWHSEIDDYYNAKTQLFRHQTSDDIAIYLATNANSKRIASTGKGWKIPYFDEPGALVKNNYIHIAGNDICHTSELGLIGQHNWQNVCAAVTAVWQITRDVGSIRQALTSFTGLEHRLEYVGSINGAKYYDDSFGTTPETAIVAMKAFKEPKIIILGGSDKGADYINLAKVVKEENIRKIVLIGQQGPKIESTLGDIGYTNYIYGGRTMKEIIDTTSSLAQPGDIVLLSPACASFDMFKNYKDRGQQFKQAVLKLAQVD